MTRPGHIIAKSSPAKSAQLPHRSYEQSVGASAMNDDLLRKFERAAYNYLLISPDDEIYKSVGSTSLALQLYKFALFNSRMSTWDNIAGILTTAATQAKRTKNAEENPVWIAMFRHARNAPTSKAAEEFLRHSIIHPSADEAAWQDMPEILKFEGLQYSASNSRARQSSLMSVEALRAYFPSPDHQVGAILSVCHIYDRDNNSAELKHSLQLLHDLDADFFYLRKRMYSGFLFRLVKYRSIEIDPKNDKLKLYEAAWKQAVALPTSISPVRNHAMKALYVDRVSTANALNDDDASKAAHEDWRKYLESLISRINGTTQ